MPLERRKDLQKKIIQYFGESKEDVEHYIAQTGDLMSLAIMIGTAAVNQIQEAFQTEGFGEWKPNSPYTIANKGSAMPLVDTGSLRQAITFEVEEK